MISEFYCNEIDPYAAEWLRELMKAGQIPNGEVDERSIKDVAPTDVAGDGQRHFFAGIAGWCEALRLAGWPAERSVWTGSCPCQPYSQAGKRKGSEDERDLWPDFFRLIRKCRPDTIFGEQVPGAIKHGWLDRVHADLEREGYAVGHCVLGAHSVGSPHIRQRLYWVGHTNSTGLQGRISDSRVQREARCPPTRQGVELSSNANGLAHAESARHEALTKQCGQQLTERTPDALASHSGASWMVNSERNGVGRNGGTAFRAEGQSDRSGVEDGASGEQPAMSGTVGGVGQSNGSGWRTGIKTTQADGHGYTPEPASGTPWSEYRVVNCRDGKARRIPVEPEFFPLAHGVPGRVGLLRGYGNAICVQTAAAFVRAFLEAEVGAL